MKILALDLGKFNTLCCFFETCPLFCFAPYPKE